MKGGAGGNNGMSIIYIGTCGIGGMNMYPEGMVEDRSEPGLVPGSETKEARFLLADDDSRVWLLSSAAWPWADEYDTGRDRDPRIAKESRLPLGIGPPPMLGGLELSGEPLSPEGGVAECRRDDDITFAFASGPVRLPKESYSFLV